MRSVNPASQHLYLDVLTHPTRAARWLHFRTVRTSLSGLPFLGSSMIGISFSRFGCAHSSVVSAWFLRTCMADRVFRADPTAPDLLDVEVCSALARFAA